MTTIHHDQPVQRTSAIGVRETEYGDIGQLAAEIQRLQATKQDYVVDTRRMSFTTPDAVSLLTFDAEDGGTAGGPVNEFAHRQLREWAGIPAKYYDRLRADAPALLDTNVRHWLYDEERERHVRMVRMLEGRVRAFLSNRYRRLDNFDLMEKAVGPELAKHEGLTFHVASMTPDRFYLRAVLPRLQASIRVGDEVQAGVQIRNSEVGDGKLEVAPFVWRLVCLNGMVRADMSLGRYHVGREAEDTLAIYRDDTLAADDAAYWLKVRDAVGAALSDVTFGRIVAQMQAAATGERVADPVAATEKLAKQHDLTETEGGSVLTFLAAGGDLSQWGVANAVTAAAKQADSFDRQEELERLGGELVALPAGEWSKIAR
jgi:hypothetical protein